MICNYCGCRDFTRGIGTEVMCANPTCRHWFNAMPAGLDDLHRVEPLPTDDWLQRARDIVAHPQYGNGRPGSVSEVVQKLLDIIGDG